jgi:4-aminobutyrate aminotransferase-like enzyme
MKKEGNEFSNPLFLASYCATNMTHSIKENQEDLTGADSKSASPITSVQAIAWESQYSAHNYRKFYINNMLNVDPLPVVFHKAKGARVWDLEDNEYLDFLSACN